MSRRPVPAVLTAIAVLGPAWGFHRMLLAGSCTTPPGPGEVACPPEYGWYAAALIGGFVAVFVAVLVYSAWGAFVGIFAGIGLAALLAGLRPASEGGEGWYLALGAVFVAAPFVGPLVAGLVGAASRKRHRSLVERGLHAVATVLDVGETGVSAGNDPRVLLRVRIEPDGGEPYESTQRRLVGRLEVPRAGDRFAVLVDPDDRHAWVDAEGPAYAFARRRRS